MGNNNHKTTLIMNGEGWPGVSHAKELLDSGSHQDDLWGINLYPELSGDDFVEFDSMINVRPRLQNFSRGVEDKNLQKKILSIVFKLVK